MRLAPDSPNVPGGLPMRLLITASLCALAGGAAMFTCYGLLIGAADINKNEHRDGLLMAGHIVGSYIASGIVLYWTRIPLRRVLAIACVGLLWSGVYHHHEWAAGLVSDSREGLVLLAISAFVTISLLLTAAMHPTSRSASTIAPRT